jgi:hypothetical protein
MDAEEQRRCIVTRQLDRQHVNSDYPKGAAGLPWPSATRQQAVARLGLALGREMTDTRMTIEQMDGLIDWTLFKWREAKSSNERGETMQDEIVIELRADFGGDKEKTDAMVRVACSMARTMKTNAVMLGALPRNVHAIVRSGDFFASPKEIGLYDDLIAKGQEALDAVFQGAADEALGKPTQRQDEIIDQELLDAVKGLSK